MTKNTQTDNSINEELREILGSDDYFYTEKPYLLNNLIQHTIDKAVIEARVDELQIFSDKWKNFGNVMYGDISDENIDGSRVFYREAYPIQKYCIDDRIKELKGEGYNEN